jgi:hypothetical protein
LHESEMAWIRQQVDQALIDVPRAEATPAVAAVGVLAGSAAMLIFLITLTLLLSAG